MKRDDIMKPQGQREKAKPASRQGGEPHLQREKNNSYEKETELSGSRVGKNPASDKSKKSFREDPTQVREDPAQVGAVERTRIYRAGSHSPSEKEVEQNDPMNDPPSGWLVVVDGPGKGHVLKVGYGANSIGRSSSERISLDFGDDTISSKGQAVLSYDSRGKSFYLQGGGTNLIYVDDKPVFAPQELKPFTVILIGDTTLRFVPLCGESFSWD